MKFIIGKEYQVVKRGREYHGGGEEYNVGKLKGKKYNLTIKLLILCMLGRISS